jgi:ribosomal protein S18
MNFSDKEKIHSKKILQVLRQHRSCLDYKNSDLMRQYFSDVGKSKLPV